MSSWHGTYLSTRTALLLPKNASVRDTTETNFVNEEVLQVDLTPN